MGMRIGRQTEKNGENMEKSNRCILVCAGDLEISEIPVREGDLVIAVDGGCMYCEVLDIEPDIIIGDFDSLTEEYICRLEEEGCGKEKKKKQIIRLNPVKDDTDTLAAIRLGLQKGYREFHLYGAMGGRLEHTIANLQCLHYLKEEGATGYLWDGNMMATVIVNESISFRREMEGMVSVFATGGIASGVTEKGLKYLLNDAKITSSFPIGVSNEFIGDAAEISVKDGALLIIVRWT